MRSPAAQWAAAAPGGTAEHGAHAAAAAAAATAEQEQDCAGSSDMPWLREHEHVHYSDTPFRRFSRAKVIDGYVGEKKAALVVRITPFRGYKTHATQLLLLCQT